MSKTIIAGLVHRITSASNAYYNLKGKDTIKVSDIEFDLMVEELRDLDPSNPILFQTGWGAVAEDGFYPHSEVVTGLDDNKWENVDASYYYDLTCVMEKLDGLTFVAYYKERELSKVLTRGTGDSGRDITQAAIFAGVPLRVPFDLEWVRGEAVLSHATFEAGAQKDLWKEDTHPRNVAAGIMNSNDTERARFLDMVVFDVKFGNDDDDSFSLDQRLIFISCCFKTVHRLSCGVHSEGAMSYYSHRQKQGEWPIDGLVCMRSDGYKSKLKFPASQIEEMEVKIVEARMRRTGKVSFRVWFKDPKFISGCWFRKATGNNYQWLLDRGIGQGSIVRVKRANEVIPNLLDEKAVKELPLVAPTHCPVCKGELTQYKSDLMCMNEECRCKKGEIGYRFFSRSAPKGVGGSFLEELLEWIDIHEGDCLIKECISFAKAFKSGEIISKQVFSTEYKQNQLEVLMENLFKEKISIASILSMLNMRSWGWTKCTKFGKYFLDVAMDEKERIDAAATFTYIEYLPASRESEWYDLVDYFRELIELNSTPDEVEEVPADLIRFGMTGKINTFQKSDYALKLMGRAVWDDKNMQILVTDSERESSKMQSAKEKGLEVVSSAEFLRRMGF